MTNLIVRGGRPLRGSITPSANKNAVLPVLCATLLTDQPVTLHRVPDITDVRKILDFFGNLGSAVDMDYETGTLNLRHGEGLNPKAAHLPLGMRSTLMLIPPLLHRFGAASIEEDATGCTLGAREIDPHIEVFQTFGAEVLRTPEALYISTPRGFAASDHWLDYASVTTTENFALCAATAKGRSQLTNAACEPHVQEFCAFLARMGADVSGVGGSRLTVEGVDKLGGAEFTFADDFHEVATFLAMGAITGGEVSVKNGASDQFPLLDRTFAKFGVEVTHKDGWSSARIDGKLAVRAPFTSNILTKVEAAPWPYVPADLLPIFVALGVRAEGSVMFWNKVYEGALGWTQELGKFGAHAVLCDPHRLITYGGKPLMPAEVESPYIIRVAIALFMLAASIEGQSTILNAAPIKRAHPRFVENLNALGADVEWVYGD
ncbi:UDP-N-acetylglucosamine 1-carboxyvinyltransferase [Phenylobacterium aquaticum]|uniref:UDP-N-acetylglucosamine 1-carboxyvinyltransferase n=1 Tax=Phenylobacterium aquaticum TaxID=1763816 RepID=UPI0026ECEFF5|nr:UDP-N-acetylglucosamine 1-carboxyvinyltransferase [Phenylobacterium aquaticum]